MGCQSVAGEWNARTFCTIDLMVTMEHRPATGCRLPLRKGMALDEVTLFIQLKAMSGEALSSKLFAIVHNMDQ